MDSETCAYDLYRLSTYRRSTVISESMQKLATPLSHCPVSLLAIYLFIYFFINLESIFTSGQQQYFEVNSTTGVITINPIDRDALETEVFRFTIVAYETEDENSSISSTIIIIVEDINDHSPEISPEQLSITILEETFMTLEFNESIVISDPDLVSVLCC